MDELKKKSKEDKKSNRMSHLSLYGVFTPAILGVLHLIYSKLDAATPNTATIKHILAEEVRFSFRRLLMYAPEKKK